MKKTHIIRALCAIALFVGYHLILISITSYALTEFSKELNQSHPDMDISIQTNYIKKEVSVQLKTKELSENISIYPNYLINGVKIKLHKLDFTSNKFIKISSGPIILRAKTQPLALAIPFLRKNFNVELEVDDLDIHIDTKKLSIGKAIVSSQIKNFVRSQIFSFAALDFGSTNTTFERFNLFNALTADKISSTILSKKQGSTGKLSIKSLQTLVDVTKDLDVKQKLALFINKKALATLQKAYPIDLEISAGASSNILSILNIGDTRLSKPVQATLTVKSTSPISDGKTSTDISLTPSKNHIKAKIKQNEDHTLLDQERFTEISNAYINLFNPLPRKLFKIDLDYTQLKRVAKKKQAEFLISQDLSSISDIKFSMKTKYTNIDNSRRFLNFEGKLKTLDNPKTLYAVINGKPFQLAFHSQQIQDLPHDAVILASISTNLDTNQHPYLILLNHIAPNREPFKTVELKAVY